MGLFSWLFKKKKDAPKEEERHFIDDVQKERKPRKATIKNEAEKSNIEHKKAEPTGTEVLKNEPEEDATATKIGEDKSAESVKVKGFGGAFDIKKSRDGRYVFNLYAPNHIIVATSQVYSSASSAVNGIQSIISNADKAPIEDNSLKNPTKHPFPKWEMYIDKGSDYRFRLFASNGNCVVHSQGYKQKSSCKNGIDSIIRCSRNAEIDKSYLKKE